MLAKKLVDAGLWARHPSGDGWQVPDYLRDNPSKAESEARRAEISVKRSEAGRKGAEARWQGGKQSPEDQPRDPDKKPGGWVDKEFFKEGVNGRHSARS